MERIVPIEKACIVRCYGDREKRRMLAHGQAFFLAEPKKFFETPALGDSVSKLPVPVVPIVPGGIREELFSK